jgi:hypothetical protein
MKFAPFLGLCFLVISSGCVHGNRAPRARIDRPGLFQLYQAGLAQKPATATETTTQAAATVPPGVPVTAAPRMAWSCLSWRISCAPVSSMVAATYPITGFSTDLACPRCIGSN